MIKKSFLLIIVAAGAIFIDGTLTHDIFDYRLDSFSKWATLILVLGIFVSISWPKTIKNKKILKNESVVFCFVPPLIFFNLKKLRRELVR